MQIIPQLFAFLLLTCINFLLQLFEKVDNS